MKLIKNFPKKLFSKSKKTRSINSRSDDDPSFGSGSTMYSSENSLHKLKNGVTTPTSVLPTLSNEIEWSEEIFTSSDHFVQAFSVIDRVVDGKIRKEQLEAILSRVGGHEPPTQEELALLLEQVDKNADGCISLEDFGMISSSSIDELKDAFDFFDTDHDGKITAEELFNVFGIIGDARCTLEDCKRMINGVDKNGDGFVCFDDFCLMMEQQQR